MIGITLAFFKPGDIVIENEDNAAEINGSMKYGSYVDRSLIQKNPSVTEGYTSGRAATYLSDKNQVIKNGIWMIFMNA
jgi:hypothetical protein